MITEKIFYLKAFPTVLEASDGKRDSGAKGAFFGLNWPGSGPERGKGSRFIEERGGTNAQAMRREYFLPGVEISHLGQKYFTFWRLCVPW